MEKHFAGCQKTHGLIYDATLSGQIPCDKALDFS